MNRRALVAFVVGLVVAPTTSWTTQSASTSAAAAAVSIPFEWVNKHIIVSVSVNGSRPLPFVLDTGARRALIKLDRARALGLTLQGEVLAGGAGPGRATGSFVRNATLVIPTVSGFSEPLTLALPLVNLAPTLGRDIDGIIGGEFIKHFVVELDYVARRITLHDRKTFKYSGPGESLPIQFNSDGHPIMKAEVTPLGGQPIAGTFLLDTGSGLALALHSPFVASRLLLGPHLTTIRAIGMSGAGGAVTGQIGRVAELRLGTFKLANPITLFAEDKAGALANAALAGNIGGQIASRFKMFLDYSHNRVILEPSTRFGDAFDRAFGGLSVRAEGQDYRTFRITQILDNSPASEAGLQKDDIITAIESRPAAELTLTEVIEMFERPQTYELTLQRGGQVVKATLTPKKLL